MKTQSYLRLLIPFLLLPFAGRAFGVLTHEAIIDAVWDKALVPLLKQKYPAATPEEIKNAHAYAYGGAVAPDMGYYPRGSRLFTDLVHYVRSGDMVNALLKDADNIDQYAFALGFLSHYEADKYGHPLGTNRSVGLVYPKVGEKYGEQITYEQDKIAHVRMEFGFDVLEVAKGNYASQSYRDFIGFKVDTAVLSKAFKETYGLDINPVFGDHFSRAVETFRWIVANIFPVITKAAWAQKKAFIKEHDSTATAERFGYRMHQKNYNREFGKGYQRPGFGPSLLSFFIRALPKIGPTKALKFKAPTPAAEKYFDQSFDTILHYFNTDIQKLRSENIPLRDVDFDTGKPTTLCEYGLATRAYSKLLRKLSDGRFEFLTPALQQNIAGFYQDSRELPAAETPNCKKFFSELNELRSAKIQ